MNDILIRVDNIYKKHDITVKCFNLGNILSVPEKRRWKMIEKIVTSKEQIEFTELMKHSKKLANYKFVCRVYYKGDIIGHVEFTFITDKIVYIDGIHRSDSNVSFKSKLQYMKLLLFYTLYRAKKKGAKTVILIPTDDGSGKLYRYYYRMGFRCVQYENKPIELSDADKVEITTYNDFISNSLETNMYQCYTMKADINDVLSHCC